jgi:hypothetical protein
LLFFAGFLAVFFAAFLAGFLAAFFTGMRSSLRILGGLRFILLPSVNFLLFSVGDQPVTDSFLSVISSLQRHLNYV